MIPPRTRTHHNHEGRPQSSLRAFTFVEILAAMVFLAILIPAILQGLTISTRAGLYAERGAVAAELAQNKLNELSLDDAWITSDMSGNFGADWPGMRWEADVSTWDLDSMERITVRAFYTVQGREDKVELSTLVSSGSSATTGTLSSSNSKTSGSSK
jgi:type II secretory pathway pseudopilin PulG